MAQVTVIGGGLAGSECALQLARRGISVTLMEMRPQTMTPAHHIRLHLPSSCAQTRSRQPVMILQQVFSKRSFALWGPSS